MEPTKEQTNQLSRVLLPLIEEKDRLKKLSNIELVDEVSSTAAADDDRVSEMMDRLDPEWYVRDE